MKEQNTREFLNEKQQSQADIMAKYRETVLKKKKRRDITIIATVLVFIVAACVVLSLSVFFNIAKIEVTGETRYSSAEITEKSGIALDSNMFKLDKEAVCEKLEKELPYIGKAEISFIFPDGINISIRETAATIAISMSEGYAFMNDEGKILETSADLPSALALVYGFTLENISPGLNVVDYTAAPEQTSIEPSGDNGKKSSAETTKSHIVNETPLELLRSLIKAVSEFGFKDIMFYDVRDAVNLKLSYQSRYIIHLGGNANLPEKLKLAEKAIAAEDLKNINRTGIVDVSQGSKASVRSESYETLPQETTVESGSTVKPDSSGSGSGQASTTKETPPQTGEKTTKKETTTKKQTTTAKKQTTTAKKQTTTARKTTSPKKP